MKTLASLLEESVGRRGGTVLDDRRLPLFKLGARVREADGAATFLAEVVDPELIEQGAPQDVVLYFIPLPNLPPAVIARALEPCLVDHPRLQLVHSAALPSAALAAVQPAEPSPLLPPIHMLPLCDEAGVLVLVQESVDGVSLLKWRQLRGAGLKLSELSDLLETTSEVLASLHRRGFAHGALTPETISLQEFVSPTMVGQAEERVWVPKIVDFGLTRTLAAPGTWPSGAAATWCAPEAFAPDALTDWRKVDQLGLAALLFALWTDRVPFEAIPDGTPAEEARKIRRTQIEALPPPRGNKHARALGVTPAMSAACMRALSPDPADRFPSMDAFAAALRSAAREAGRKQTAEDTSDDGPTGTQPQSSITSRFRTLSGRTTDSAKVQAPSTNPGSPALPFDKPTDKLPERASPKPQVTEPDEKPAVEKPAIEKPAKPVSKPPPAPSDVATEPAPPRASYAPPPVATGELKLFPNAETEKEKGRRTQVLTSPGEPVGAYPEHPDREPPSKPPAPADPHDVEAAGFSAPSKWAFNHLAAALLVLWLGTLVWALVSRSSAPDQANGNAPTKVERKGRAAQDAP